MLVTGTWHSVEEVIPHAVEIQAFLLIEMVHHRHLVLVLRVHGEALRAAVHLMGEKAAQVAVEFDFRHATKEGPVRGLVVKGDHEQSVVSVGVGVLDARVQREFQRLGVHLDDPRFQLPPFIRFVGGPLAELAVAHHVDPDCIGLDRLKRQKANNSNRSMLRRFPRLSLKIMSLLAFY